MSKQSIIVIPGAFEQTGEVFNATGDTLAVCVRRVVNYFLDDLGVDDEYDIADIFESITECLRNKHAKEWDFSSPDNSYRLLLVEPGERACLITKDEETLALGVDSENDHLDDLAPPESEIKRIEDLDHDSLVAVCEYLEEPDNLQKKHGS